jgi:hypothetical protein
MVYWNTIWLYFNMKDKRFKVYKVIILKLKYKKLNKIGLNKFTDLDIISN